MKKKKGSKTTKSRSLKKVSVKAKAIVVPKTKAIAFETTKKHDAILYAHVKKVNKAFIYKQAKAQKLSVSEYVDQVADHMRANI